MSQQKIFLALCLVAGLIAAVSAQWSIDVNKCSQSLQENMEKFRGQFTGTMNQCIEEFRSHGQNAIDTETMSKETSSMMNGLSSLANANGLDANRWMTVMQGVAGSYMRLIGAMARPSSGLALYQTNLKCMTSTTRSWAEFFSSMPGGCVGGRY